jgi:hypothetical protein
VDVTGVRARTTVSLADIRVAGGLMLAGALAQPLIPSSPGIACPFHTITGLACPLCGMTRSVTAAVHLRLDDAVAYNPAGLVAVAVAVAVLLLRRIDSVAVPVWTAPVAVGLLWAWQLWRFPAI